MIVKSVLLRCGRERAFVLFTELAGEWWPADRRHTDDARSTIRIEASGRFFERSADGAEIDLGRVRAFERPDRLLLDWYPGTGAQAPTQVEVLFTDADGGTLVTIRHDRGAASADVFARKATAYAQSWDLVTDALGRRAQL